MSYIAIDPLPQDLRGLEDLEGLTPPNPGRERLQHLIIGSEEGVRGAINSLHLLRYAEQFEWSRLFAVPETGLVILPQPGEVFSYLRRWRQVN